jgi:hypothetical protein
VGQWAISIQDKLYGWELIGRTSALNHRRLSLGIGVWGFSSAYGPDKERAMNLRKSNSLITSAIVVASLALGGTAFAADAHVPAKAKTAHARVAHPHVATRAAAARHYAVVRQPADLGGFIESFFGGALGVKAARGGTYEASPSYDTSTTVDTSSAAADAQAASDAEVQAIQQMNDENALNASMAAAEQQNDAANAATLQTEINAGM